MSRRRSRIALCALLFALCICVWAQPGVWKNQPEKIRLKVNKNDDHLSFIFHQDTSSEITVIRILINGGKRAVPASLRGLALITTRLSLEMTTAASVRELMHLGSNFIYHVEGDYSMITIKSLSGNLEETLGIIVKIMKNPLFSGIRIGNIKKYMEHRQKREKDSLEHLMELTCFNAFFDGYDGSIFGNDDSRKKIKKKNILQFYNRFFNRANMIISVSSDLTKTSIEKIIKKYFAAFPGGEPLEARPVRASIPGEKEFFLKKDNQQVLISFAALLPGMSRKNYALICMLENLLGKGIGCKLWPLRAQKDLAYSLNTKVKQLQEGGLFIIYLKTDAEKKEEAYTALKELINDFYKSGITEDELHTAKVLARANFLRANETKGRKALNMAYFEAMGLGFNFLEDFFAYVDQITSADFNIYMKKLLTPAHLIEVIIGPDEGNGRLNR